MAETARLRVRDLILALGLCLAGCATITPEKVVECGVPRELDKTILPDYFIEPPDILLIDALTVAPKPPYKIQPLDVLVVSVPNAFPTDPINGLYPVDPDGTINLGVSYGSVKVAGLTLKEAQAAVEEFLKPRIKDVKAVVSLGQSRVLQQIRGQHLVTPDGKVRLGVYGSVTVVRMTIPEAKAAIEEHLSQYLDRPEVSVDVVGYNSKVFYAILDGGGNGQLVLRLPITGNDTVLDALSQIGGLTSLSSKHRIWISRPTPAGAECDEILPVDWVGITTRGRTETNYQLLPGDRIYVHANPVIALDTALARIVTPIERVLGLAILGAGTVSSYQGLHQLGAGVGGTGAVR
jgi:polysaccharide export outer membrane protein